MDKLIIYKASAGSGKTYKLTEEYLKLAFKKSFQHILAVTFTNKATAEMKQRIIAELFRISSGEDSSYLQVLGEDTGLNDEDLRKRAAAILESLLHNFSRFSVGTIDSFFQRIIRGFAREAGLQSGFDLELDNIGVLDKATDRLLPAAEKDKALQEWLTDFAVSRIREGKSWNFRDDIGRLGRQVFREEFMQFRKELTGKLSDREFMDGYLKSLQIVRKEFESAMKAFGRQALEIMGERSLAAEDFSYGRSGVAGYFESLSTGKKYEPGIRALGAVDNVTDWYAKKSEKKDEIETAFNEGLNSCLKSAVDHFHRHHPAYLGAGIVVAEFYTLGILNDLTLHIREYLEENNLFLLSDVAVLLGRIIRGNDSPFIYEKTGYFYSHFMIDEFQDTSRIQWENFSPLIRNSLAENNRNILVGDVKQSIYRWRNGDWKILAGEIEREMEVFEPRTVSLETNWRSRELIVKFNNALFEEAPVIMQRQFVAEFEGSGLPQEEGVLMGEQITGAYREHVQKVPEKAGREGGFVSVRFVETGSGNWKDEVAAGLPELINGIRGRGYSLKDIAILVRDNREGRLAASSLIRWQGETGGTAGERLSFISEEFLLLSESHSVLLLVALMKYLDDPDDDINKALILNEYINYAGRQGAGKVSGHGDEGDNGGAHGSEDEQDQGGEVRAELLSGHDLFGIVSGDDDGWLKHLPAGFASRLEYLKRLSLFELTEELISLTRLNESEREVPYLLAFQDMIIEFAGREGGGLHSFLRWWEENGAKATVSTNEKQDAVRIMTIHKAKGLQFGVVIVPFGDWKTDHEARHDNILWCSPLHPPFNRLELVPVRYKSELAGSIFAREYFAEKMQAFVDNLNLLYVAFTRCKSELFAFAPLPAGGKGGGQVRSTGELLFRTFTNPSGENRANGIDLTSHWNGDEKLFTAGTPRRVVEKGEISEGGDLRFDSYPVSDYSGRLRLRLRGNIFFAGDREIQKRIDEGRIMHEIFEHIITAGDVEKAVNRLCYQGVIGEGEAEELTGRINDMLEDERVFRWFDGSMRVRNEAGILLQGGDVKRPDRVMMKGDDVTVLDYKFGEQMHPANTRQMRGYMEELAKMGYRSVTGYIWYVSTGNIEEVVHE